jgi:hypothetical protein
MALPALAPPVGLGALSLVNGNLHDLYISPNHTNLLVTNSRFLITEEDAVTPPSNPSPDKGTWHYTAQLPQTPDSMDMMHEGALQHLRHLLVDAPELTTNKLNLPGGLDIWLFRNAQKILEWSGSARDFWANKNTNGIDNQVIHILDYLDGSAYVQQDIPAGMPVTLVNPLIAPLALLDLDQHKQNPPGLLYIIGVHLGALVQAPGISQENHVLAGQIDLDSNNVQLLLKQVRADAKQVLAMAPAQLLSNNGLSVLDDMETAARYAYIGKIDPNTNSIQGGVIQIHYSIERLAALDITQS